MPEVEEEDWPEVDEDEDGEEEAEQGDSVANLETV